MPAQPIGRGKKGTAKRKIAKSGGGRKTLTFFRGLGKSSRRNLMAKSKAEGTTLTQAIRSRRKPGSTVDKAVLRAGRKRMPAKTNRTRTATAKPRTQRGR